MKVIVTLDRNLALFGTKLATLAERLPRAEREGLQEGGKLVLTLQRKTLRAQMNTKRQAPINAHTSGSLAGDTTFVIRGVGRGLPITDFPVKGGRKRTGTWRDQPRNGAGQFGRLPDNSAGKVVAQSWNVTHRFKRSFATTGGKFVATLPGTRQIRSLYGPSVAKELTKDQSAAVFEGQAAGLVERCVFRRIERLL